MASGDTKTEALLNILGHGGTGDEYRGSGNTKTQNYILDAIDRINAIDPSGGSSAIKVLTDADANFTDNGTDYIATWLLDGGIYTLAEDATVSIVAYYAYTDDDPEMPESVGDEFDASTRPLIITNNDINAPEIIPDITIMASSGVAYYFIDKTTGMVIDRNYSSSSFTGTDGTRNGIGGLVPAPYSYETDLFLCSDGTWKEGSGVTIVQGTGNSTTSVMSQRATTTAIGNATGTYNIASIITNPTIDASGYDTLESAILENKRIIARVDMEVPSGDVTNRYVIMYDIVGYNVTIEPNESDPEIYDRRNIYIDYLEQGVHHEIDIEWNDGSPTVNIT